MNDEKNIMNKKTGSRYDDIINMPHHVSSKHKQMSAYDRAAQFSPFAALTGHSAAVAETARLTERRIELDENAREELDRKLQMIMKDPQTAGDVQITYFIPDKLKSGGKYVTAKGRLIGISSIRRQIIMAEDTVIPIDDITDIEF